LTQQFAALSINGPVLQLPTCGSSKAEKGGSNHGANQQSKHQKPEQIIAKLRQIEVVTT
jgi:hypothetical protein